MSDGEALTIDINADAGESFGHWRLGDDEALFPLLTSVNLAAGFHAGDPLAMRAGVALARQHHVAVGAHPGFPDVVGFGRRDIDATPDQVYSDVLYQIGALSAFLRAAGLPLHHVKPHGALYNRSTRHADTARAVAQAVLDYDAALPLVVLAGSLSEEVARSLGSAVIREAFPDRAYLADGRLVPRAAGGALVRDPEAAARRAVQMVIEHSVEVSGGITIPLQAETLCIHGDDPEAPAIVRAVRAALGAAGVSVAAF